LRARAAISNAEARLRGLVNDPRFTAQGVGELVPVEPPLAQHEQLSLQDIVERAVAFRPEVQQAFLNHRAAVLREGQSQIEALPRADLILGANVGGRALDTGRYEDAWQDSGGHKPGFFFGLRIEVPLQTDDAKARLSRRRLETRLAENQGRAALVTIIAEAEVTLNEYEVAWRELGARALAVQAARTELGLEADRWQQGIGVTQEGAPNTLERLLGAQDRLADAEERLALAQVTFTLAFLALQRVQGTFTAVQNIEIQRIDDAARGPAFNVRRAAASPWTPVQKK
jgi:outer membrane protein TolC